MSFAGKLTVVTPVTDCADALVIMTSYGGCMFGLRAPADVPTALDADADAMSDVDVDDVRPVAVVLTL